MEGRYFPVVTAGFARHTRILKYCKHHKTKPTTKIVQRAREHPTSCFHAPFAMLTALRAVERFGGLKIRKSEQRAF